MAKTTKAAQAHTQSGQTAKPIKPFKQPPAPPSSEPPRVEGPRPIKVRATRMTYYDHGRRREGDVFYIARKSDFNEKCMEYVDPHTPERVTGAGAALQQQHDDILAGRAPGTSVDDEPHI